MVNFEYIFADKVPKTFTSENAKANHRKMQDMYPAKGSSSVAAWITFCRITDAIKHATTVQFEETTYQEVISNSKPPYSSFNSAEPNYMKFNIINNDKYSSQFNQELDELIKQIVDKQNRK